MEHFVVSNGIVDCTYVRSPCLFVRFCNVFRYEWWVLTAAQEIVTAESLGFINGAKQLVWEMAGVRKVIRTADESNRAGP
jgi:hypothetical protein